MRRAREIVCWRLKQISHMSWKCCRLLPLCIGDQVDDIKYINSDKKEKKKTLRYHERKPHVRFEPGTWALTVWTFDYSLGERIEFRRSNLINFSLSIKILREEVDQGDEWLDGRVNFCELVQWNRTIGLTIQRGNAAVIGGSFPTQAELHEMFYL